MALRRTTSTLCSRPVSSIRRAAQPVTSPSTSPASASPIPLNISKNVTLTNSAARLNINSSWRRLYAECNEATEVTPESLEATVRAAIRVTNMIVRDTSGNGSFFLVAVQSPDFNGLSMLKQHQMLNKILKGALNQVHGITLKTLPDEDKA